MYNSVGSVTVNSQYEPHYMYQLEATWYPSKCHSSSLQQFLDVLSNSRDSIYRSAAITMCTGQWDSHSLGPENISGPKHLLKPLWY